MVTNRGLALDLLTRVRNIHWNVGLAVEFGNKAEDAPKPAVLTGVTKSSKE